MDANTGTNEGIRVLEDFACNAIPGSEAGAADSPGQGTNAGIAESNSAGCDSPFRIGALRAAELRSLSNAELVDILTRSSSTLSPGELWVIHEIGVERLAEAKDAQSENADELSRNVMLVTLNRVAGHANASDVE